MKTTSADVLAASLDPQLLVTLGHRSNALSDVRYRRAFAT